MPIGKGPNVTATRLPSHPATQIPYYQVMQLSAQLSGYICLSSCPGAQLPGRRTYINELIRHSCPPPAISLLLPRDKISRQEDAEETYNSKHITPEITTTDREGLHICSLWEGSPTKVCVCF